MISQPTAHGDRHQDEPPQRRGPASPCRGQSHEVDDRRDDEHDAGTDDRDDRAHGERVLVGDARGLGGSDVVVEREQHEQADEHLDHEHDQSDEPVECALWAAQARASRLLPVVQGHLAAPAAQSTTTSLGPAPSFACSFDPG